MIDPLFFFFFEEKYVENLKSCDVTDYRIFFCAMFTRKGLKYEWQVDIDFDKEPIGTGKDGKSVYFKYIWPSNEEIAEVVQNSVLPDMFKRTYEAITKATLCGIHYLSLLQVFMLGIQTRPTFMSLHFSRAWPSTHQALME